MGKAHIRGKEDDRVEEDCAKLLAPDTSFPRKIDRLPLRDCPVKKVTGYFICNGLVRVDFSEPPFEGAEICDEAKKIIKEGCVPLEDLKKYKGQKKALYGLKVFTTEKFSHKPMDITQFNIKRPPQSWCYTEVDLL